VFSAVVIGVAPIGADGDRKRRVPCLPILWNDPQQVSPKPRLRYWHFSDIEAARSNICIQAPFGHDRHGASFNFGLQRTCFRWLRG
jgi:hypothetical protein